MNFVKLIGVVCLTIAGMMVSSNLHAVENNPCLNQEYLDDQIQCVYEMNERANENDAIVTESPEIDRERESKKSMKFVTLLFVITNPWNLHKKSCDSLKKCMIEERMQ